MLAPTHELSRQLSSFAKSLVHTVKLRVMCASQANVKSGSGKEREGVSSRKMARVMEEVGEIQEGGKENATRSEMGKMGRPGGRHAHEIVFVRDGSWKGLGSGGVG